MMEVASFLQSVAGYTHQTQPGESSTAPVKIGTIDAAYSGTGFAKVKFDGESVTSVKPYPFLASYFPVPGDRVVLMPAGNTYVIVGKIDDTVNNLVKRVAALEAVPGGALGEMPGGQAIITANSNTVSSATFADVTNLSCTITAGAGRQYEATFTYRGTQSSVANDVAVVCIAVAGNPVVENISGPLVANSARYGGSMSTVDKNPPAGARTYKIQLRRLTGTGAVAIAAAAGSQAELNVKDAGPA